MSSIEKYLFGHAFFKGMSEDYVKLLAEFASEKHAARDEVLFQLGKPADKFYLLRSGKVSVQVPALVGPPLELQLLGEDQLLGWSWLIPPYRWNFLARAVEESELIEFDGGAILARCEADPGFGYDLFKRFAALMSERLESARLKMIDEWNPAGFA